MAGRRALFICVASLRPGGQLKLKERSAVFALLARRTDEKVVAGFDLSLMRLSGWSALLELHSVDAGGGECSQAALGKQRRDGGARGAELLGLSQRSGMCSRPFASAARQAFTSKVSPRTPRRGCGSPGSPVLIRV